MPGKDIKLIGKTIHPDGYYTASSLISTTSHEASESEAAAATEPSKMPHIKLWYRKDKGIFIGPEEREKLIREEELQAAAKKEEIPTPGFALVKESVVEDDDYSTTTSMAASTFQSKLDATKRKMHDSYQQLANAKKQKRIQVIDPRDLPPPPPTTQSSSSKGKGGVVAARKKMITTNRKTMNNNNNLFNGGRSRLVKPTSIF